MIQQFVEDVEQEILFLIIFRELKSYANEDDKEQKEILNECLSNLILETDRINEFELDIKNISPIIEKGVKWQRETFANIPFEELRFMRRLFTN